MSVGFSKRRFTEYRDTGNDSAGNDRAGNDGAGNDDAGRSAERRSKIILDFRVDDVDAEYERIDALGVEWVMPPTTQPWGNRSMIFTDPEGNLINVFSRP
jgi:uncharacterized glyoxalase superfamily protein PhnB